MAGDDDTAAGRTRLIEPRFQIVFVCTGNRFRSPIAAAFVQKHGAGLPLDLRSLGTLDTGPAPPLEEAFEVGAKYGLDLTGHRARSIAGARLAGADLVLGFERLHVARAVVDAGAARARTFTFPELADLLRSIPKPARLGTTSGAREVVARAAELRTMREDWLTVPELRDPLGGPPRGYQKTATVIEKLCASLLRGLFGRSPEPVPKRFWAQPAAPEPPSGS